MLRWRLSITPIRNAKVVPAENVEVVPARNAIVVPLKNIKGLCLIRMLPL